MALARRHPEVELIAVDAMQVYRRMDIGTAKPSLDDRAAVQHHCLDLVDAADEFTVTDFAASRSDALDAIESRNDRAVLVAGTGLYLRSVTDPMEVPGRWPEVRAELTARAEAEGVETLARPTRWRSTRSLRRRWNRPTPAVSCAPSRSRSAAAGRSARSARASTRIRPIRFEQFGLRWPRPVLTKRIAERVHRMIDAGLVAEVESLAARPDLANGSSGARLQGVVRPPRRRLHTRRGRSRRSSPAPVSSRCDRSGGSAATRAYAGSTSTTIRWPKRCRYWKVHGRARTDEAPRIGQRLPGRRSTRTSRICLRWPDDCATGVAASVPTGC